MSNISAAVPDCKYTKIRSSVACEDQTKCSKCGWNPLVDMERKQKNRDKRIEMLRKGAVEDKSIKDTYKFIKEWTDLIDEQYKHFEDYFNKRMDLIHDAFNSLCDTSSRMASDNRENMDKLVDYSNRMRELLKTEVEQVDKIRDFIENSNDVNDERWDLIHDYIVNHDPMDDHYQTMIKESTPGYEAFYDPDEDDFTLVSTQTHDGLMKHFNKEDKINEHENLGSENGTPEVGRLWDQEDEQAQDASGKEDAFLVRGELEEDGLDAPAEAKEI